MQSGELFVTGSNSINITLSEFPAEVRVKFKHEQHEPAPCDPGNVDFLTYHVESAKTGAILTITWNVSSVREIVWHAAF